MTSWTTNWKPVGLSAENDQLKDKVKMTSWIVKYRWLAGPSSEDAQRLNSWNILAIHSADLPKWLSHCNENLFSLSK